MKNELAVFLKAKKQASGGAIAEFFVMDNKGLNVGQTDPTSDFWQGDEANWQKSFGAGPDAIFVDKVEDDGGLKVAQTSLSTADPKTKKPIGAITVVVDTGKLPNKRSVDRVCRRAIRLPPFVAFAVFKKVSTSGRLVCPSWSSVRQLRLLSPRCVISISRV